MARSTTRSQTDAESAFPGRRSNPARAASKQWQGRVAGCDLGKAIIKFAIGAVDADGTLAVDSLEDVVHEGKPLEAFRTWYERRRVFECAALGATGLYAPELIRPVVSPLPSEACLTSALSHTFGAAGPLNLIVLGARGYTVLSRSDTGQVRCLENEKCSSGTGETIVRTAQRFGLSLGQADELAARTTDAIPITARCSVFAKSEMTHFGNEGKAIDALFRGYFQSVARYAAALLARIRVVGPVFVAGGGSQIRSIVQALSERLEQKVQIVSRPLHLEAVGAALLAAEQALAGASGPLPEMPSTLIAPRASRFAILAPAREFAKRVTRLEPTPQLPDEERRPLVLGLDLGSTGAKASLIDAATGGLVRSVYDRTLGNPVQAAGRLVATLIDDAVPDVRAIGVTGSGREAVAAVLRAVWPAAAGRIVVENEIVAHAAAAVRCDPQQGRSLSVVEIGGQDAKFIQIRDGRIVDCDLNRACSAGTGSFLEEQALLYGVGDIEQFARRAARAERPPDLGQMCTVFVAETAAEAANEGFGVDDLLAGFQYSVIYNYIHRVMGQRTFGENIFFQGKPATNPSLAWTLSAVTDRDVVVPADPGAMGAWGIGLCALDVLEAGVLSRSDSLDLSALLAAQIVETGSFRCRDQRCDTLCVIQQTTVAVGNDRQTVLSGGACPKYEIDRSVSTRLSKDAPDAFRERRALLDPYRERIAGNRVIVIPDASACVGYLPWLVTFVRELGLGVRCLSTSSEWLSRGEERCFSYDACAPVKIMHGFATTEADTVFFPKIFSYADPDGSSGRTCPMEQAVPEMMRDALAARGHAPQIVHPRLSFAEGLDHPALARQLRAVAVQLGGDPRHVRQAVRAAARAQRQYWGQLAEIGRLVLDEARRRKVPAIVLCGPLHVIHEPAVNAAIPRLLREQSVLALPMDCFSIPEDVPRLPRVVWAESNRVLRTALAARRRGDVYPLLMTSFGCGPGSFLEQLFGHMLEDYPHAVLESDGHGGTAGYVTRIQAFLHTVCQHDGRNEALSDERLAPFCRVADVPLDSERDSRLAVFALGDRISSHVAAVYRSAGFDAVPCGPLEASDLAAGRRECSGKECLPYQVLWSGFRKQLTSPINGKAQTLVQVPGQGMCRNCMFSLKDEISLARLGLADRVRLRHAGPELGAGWGFAAKLWTAIVVWDSLFQLRAYYRPMTVDAAEVDQLYATFNDELEELLQRPYPNGLTGLIAFVQAAKKLRRLVERIGLAFADLANRAPASQGLRRVLLSGDVYLRLDELASGGLIRRLNERDLAVIVEPLSLLAEYMAEERLGELVGLPTQRGTNLILKRGMAVLRHAVQARLRRLHPWLPATDLKALLAASRTVLDRHPFGEAPITIGSVLHHWETRSCDGVVAISPWGCGPALVSESLLRHFDEIPLLFVYADGSPLDERKIDAFAFQLQRRSMR